jgi:hypothetical protein
MERIEIDVLTGERQVIELTAEEITKAQELKTQWETQQAELQAIKTAQDASKQTALNKLMALGLTEEEALSLGIK